MQHYTTEQKLKAVELYIQYNHSPMAVFYELGYPSRSCINKWYHEYLANDNTFESKKFRTSKYTEEQRKAAVEYYLTHGKSVKGTIHALGYPGKSTLCEWLNEDVPDKKRKWFYKKSGSVVRCSQEQIDQAVIDYCSGNKTPKQISEEYNISPYTIYGWKKKMLGKKEIMKKSKIPEPASSNITNLQQEVLRLTEQAESLKKEVYQLQIEKELLQKASEIIKKDQGISLQTLTNREKAIVINALRREYPLKELLKIVNMAKSSYCYQNQALNTDKYKDIRQQVKDIFEESFGTYGYRRIHAVFCNRGTVLSEKVIRRIMKEDNLHVRHTKQRKYNSYKGEISPEVENVINRDFHADKPNSKWLTDITEFHIPAGKIYLSPIIDCFDGLPVSWTIGTSPDADLVNTMLDEAIALLNEHEKPIIHSDRGCHYRWPGWISRMDHAGLIRSMSKKGCSPDNSACEGFFGHLKNEMFYGRSWIGVSIEEFIQILDSYIQWYAKGRIKISLGGMSPLDYRKSLGIAV